MHIETKRFPAARHFDLTRLHGELKQAIPDFDSLDSERDADKITLTLRFRQPLDAGTKRRLLEVLQAHEAPTFDAQTAPLDLAQRVERLEAWVAQLLEERR